MKKVIKKKITRKSRLKAISFTMAYGMSSMSVYVIIADNSTTLMDYYNSIYAFSVRKDALRVMKTMRKADKLWKRKRKLSVEKLTLSR